MRLCFLPPCGPELNPAEHLWKSLRRDGFANKVLANLDAVERVLPAGLVALESNHEKTRSTTAFKWITSLFLKAN
jgi:transposase